MSFYATIEAEISYKEKADFDAAVKLLKDSGFLAKTGTFILNEAKGRISPKPNIVKDRKFIEIPGQSYRNLTRLLEQNLLFKGATPSSWAIWASTDGTFSGGIIEGSKEETFDLVKWAKENIEDENNKTPPNEDDEDYAENLHEWQEYVLEQFFDSVN